MKKNLLIVVIPMLLLFTACNDKEQKDSTTKEKIQEKAKPTIKTNSIGITQKDGVITIDTNKAKDFLANVTKKMQSSIQNAQNTLENNKINSPDEIGITIGKDKISIDLNKTSKFLNKWAGTMEEVVGEMNSTFQEIEKTLSEDIK